MSESNGEGHRSRRRAVRSTGGPAEENATPTGAKTAAPEVSAARETAPAADSGTSSAAAESDPSTAPAASASATGDSTTDAATAVALTKADAQSSPAATPIEQKAAPSKGRNLPRVLATAAAALLVIALVCGAALSVLAMRSAHERDERRAEYVETARQAIVNLTTIRADSAKQDIDRILSLASGEFKTEFDGRVDPFTSIVQQAKVVSSGEIVEAALESDDDRSGRVLVAAKQTLTNAGQAEPQTRYYRFRVTVSRGDTGLTVSDVEFVA
jgi:Mce-associated membrane protein